MRHFLFAILFIWAPFADAQGLYVPINPSQFDPAGAASAAQSAAITATTPAMLSTPPTTAPGAGTCMRAYVPAATTSPAGTSGTCSLIEMCGTSTVYTIITTNTGNGC